MVQNIIQSPCVTALILLEGMNGNKRLSKQLWAEQLRTWFTLDLLHLSLYSGSNSPTMLLHEQLWAEQIQTILNFSPPDIGGRHLNK